VSPPSRGHKGRRPPARTSASPHGPRRRRAKRKASRKRKLLLLLVIPGAVILLLVGLGLGGAAAFRASCTFPDPHLKSVEIGQNTFVYAANGSLLGSIPSERNRSRSASGT